MANLVSTPSSPPFQLIFFTLDTMRFVAKLFILLSFSRTDPVFLPVADDLFLLFDTYKWVLINVDFFCFSYFTVIYVFDWKSSSIKNSFVIHLLYIRFILEFAVFVGACACYFNRNSFLCHSIQINWTMVCVYANDERICMRVIPFQHNTNPSDVCLSIEQTIISTSIVLILFISI